MLLAAAAGSRLSTRFTARGIVRTGLTTTAIAILILIATIDPELNDAGFAIAMAILGVGMGLIASQLGNVVQSSVDASGRGEAGGLQYTGQQLGSSLGVALIGAIVLTGLTSAFVTTIQSDQRISAEVPPRWASQSRVVSTASRGHHGRPGGGLQQGTARLAQGRPAGRGPACKFALMSTRGSRQTPRPGAARRRR